MALASNITKDLNIEQITPDPVMANPELFCLCGWCTRKAGLSSFVYLYSADYQPAFSVYLSHAGGLTADQLIFGIDQPYRNTNWLILRSATILMISQYSWLFEVDQTCQPAFSVYINHTMRLTPDQPSSCNKLMRSAGTGLISRLLRRISHTGILTMADLHGWAGWSCFVYVTIL